MGFFVAGKRVSIGIETHSSLCDGCQVVDCRERIILGRVRSIVLGFLAAIVTIGV